MPARLEAAEGTEHVGFVLICNDEACGCVWEPSRLEISTGGTECPQCQGWTFYARLEDD